tara:strand:- start:376 stop:1308 length:933 start_codon:yes stop_codon:yes gene_type:complete
MFSVVFPGQGSQFVGMTKELYREFKYVRELFQQADDALGFSLSKVILEGPKEKLDETENTQPSIFLASQSIYQIIKQETKVDLSKANFFAGHSLGEYSALAASECLNFSQTIKLLKKRGNAMQSAVPKGEGGMLAVLGIEIEKLNKILEDNKSNYKCFIANDNSNGQVVLSGKNKDIEALILDLKKNSIKNVKLPVSAPFHCELMRAATEVMKKEIEITEFRKPNNSIVSNVTSTETKDPLQIKELLVKQIESPVRWRESIIYMINKGVRKFIEIGPGKVLSGLIKRIDKNLSIANVNEINDIKNLNIND